MKVTVKHEKYGKIEYVESIFSEKKRIKINDVLLEGDYNTCFIYKNGEEDIPVYVQGSYVKGATLQIGNDFIRIVNPIAWYEIVCCSLTTVFLIAWSICSNYLPIVPIAGGAIGGAIYGIMGVFNIAVMKSIRNLPLKFLAWLGMSVLSFIVGFGILFPFAIIQLLLR